MIDTEIYKTEMYKNIFKAIVLGFISGILLTLGIFLCETRSIIISGSFLISSLVFYFHAMYVGAYKLFPEEGA